MGGTLISEIEESVEYTGIDVDASAIRRGRQMHDHDNISLVERRFPVELGDAKFDCVCVFNLFEQIEDWKTFLMELSVGSDKYINIGLSLRLSGNTVIDRDTSSGYYFNSGMGVHKIETE